jgi:hypothetical protein
MDIPEGGGSCEKTFEFEYKTATVKADTIMRNIIKEPLFGFWVN